MTPYTVTPKEGLENVIKELGYSTKVTYNDGRDPQAAAKLASESDVVLLMVGDNPHETKDRETLGFPAIRSQQEPGQRGLGEAGAADRCGSESKREEHCCDPEDLWYGAHAVAGSGSCRPRGVVSRAWKMAMLSPICSTVRSILPESYL